MKKVWEGWGLGGDGGPDPVDDGGVEGLACRVAVEEGPAIGGPEVLQRHPALCVLGSRARYALVVGLLEVDRCADGRGKGEGGSCQEEGG